MRRLGSLIALATILSLLGSVDRVYAAPLTFAGYATGCFDCTALSLTASPTTVGGLTFAGGALSVNPDQTVDLGTFALDLSAYNYSRNRTSFLLGVTFTAPAALDGAYTAEVEGTINLRGNGAVNIQLDRTFQSFSFSNAAGSGLFDFGIFDATLQLQPDKTSVALLGLIRNLQFTPNVIDPVVIDPVVIDPIVTGTQDPAVPAVPEPASLLLVGLGLSAGARLAQRRRARDLQ